MRRKQNDPPHTPEFSTTRSFPGVGAEASFEKGPFWVSKLQASGEKTLPTTPSTIGTCSPLMSAGRANIAVSTECRSISSEEQRAHQTTCFYRDQLFPGPIAWDKSNNCLPSLSHGVRSLLSIHVWSTGGQPTRY